MLTAHNLSKTYDFNPLLERINFSINPGERVGLIGPNGCGKTTLVKILAGIEPPDGGQITLNPRSLRIGYLPQALEVDPQETLGALLEQASGDPLVLQMELERLAQAISAAPHDPELLSAYSTVLQQIENLDPSLAHFKENILRALGLADLPAGTRLGELSGGQKTRLGLARLLVCRPQLLLLDEPTNHLDIQMLEWLEGWLVDYTTSRVGGSATAALIISHDRTFIDRTVNRILELDDETHRLHEYPGNYSDYIEQVTGEQQRQMAAYKDQVYEVRRMKQDIARTKQHSLRVELSTTSRQPGVRRIAKKVARKAKSREKKLDRYLESDERVEKPKPGWQMKLEFEGQPHQSQEVLTLNELAIGYPGRPALLTGINGYIRLGERIVLSGPNGCGKTTLLRTVAGLLEPGGGSLRLGGGVRIGYMSQEQELLDPGLNAVETLQLFAPLAESEARSFLHYFLFSGDDALRPAQGLSFGERSRLILASLVVQGCNFLLLDEPINHLDIPSRERFEQALAQFDGTILAVVHDRYFIERFASRVWEISEGQLRERISAQPAAPA